MVGLVLLILTFDPGVRTSHSCWIIFTCLELNQCPFPLLEARLLPQRGSCLCSSAPAAAVLVPLRSSPNTSEERFYVSVIMMVGQIPLPTTATDTFLFVKSTSLGSVSESSETDVLISWSISSQVAGQKLLQVGSGCLTWLRWP